MKIKILFGIILAAVISVNAQQYELYATYGLQNSPLSNFIPYGISVSNDNKIFVVDVGNTTIQVLTQSWTTLGYLTSIGQYGYTNGSFDIPWAISVGENGHVYVTDGGILSNIQVFTQSGINYNYSTKYGSYGSSTNQLLYPTGISARNSKVYITDNSNHRIVVVTQSGNNLDYYIVSSDKKT